MFPQQRFKPTRQALLLALIAAAYPVLGHAAAGRLDFVVGRVTAVGVDGKERVLARGAEIDAGDAVNTAANARAQIRFTDGAFVSLQPGTTFRVDQYRYAGKADGSEKGLFSLLKGGLRTITGAIGKTNRDAYQVATPAATIGIRGTGYNAQLGNSLTVSVGEGAIALLNQGGELILRAGQSGYVQDFNTAPQLTFEKPSTPPASLGSQSTTDVTTQENPPPQYCSACNTGGGVAPNVYTGVDGVVSRDSSVAYGGVTLGLDTGGTLALDSSFNRVYYQDGTSGTITSFTQATLDTAASGSYASHGHDGIVGWGRWYGTVTYSEGGVTTSLTSTDKGGLHGIAGLPATLPTMGYASYNLSGATRPTDGVNTPGAAISGSLSVYFGATPSLSGNYAYSLGGYNYNLSFGSSAWSGGRFVGSGSYVGGAGATATGGSATVTGFFAGANAERVGVVFEGSPSLGSGTNRGAMVYSQDFYSAMVP